MATFGFLKKLYTQIFRRTHDARQTQSYTTLCLRLTRTAHQHFEVRPDVLKKTRKGTIYIQPPPHRDSYKHLVNSSQYTDMIAYLQIKSTHFSLACSAVLVTRENSSLPLPCISQKYYFAQSSFEKKGAFHSKKYIHVVVFMNAVFFYP